MNPAVGVSIKPYTNLRLLCVEQVAAEQKAASTVQEGTAKRLKEADLRCESLEESLEELRVSMDRQRATYEMRCAPQLPSTSNVITNRSLNTNEFINERD